MISSVAGQLLGADIPPIILLLTLVVVVAPFVLPPVKDWKTATRGERVSVLVYFLAVVILVIYVLGYLAAR